MIQQRRLGSHGPMVGAIGLGCMALSGIYGEVEDAASIRLIHQALDAGVTHLDTANSYGKGHNEELLGRALAGRRHEVVLATKFGSQREGLGRPQEIRSALEDSLARLGTDYIDVYYMHRYDPLTPVEESVGALGELVAEGKIRHIGLSEVSAQRLRSAHAVHPITVVQQEYSLMSRDLEDELLPAMRDLGVGLVAYSPLARGMLGGSIRTASDLPPDDARRTRYPRYADDNLERNLQLANAVFEIAETNGVEPAVVALAWVLAQGEDIVPIPGTRNVDRLMSNLGALDLSLEDTVLTEIQQRVPKGAASGDRYNETMARRLDR